MAKEYNPMKLLKELEAEGLKIEGTTSEGRIDWLGEPSQADLAKAEQVKGQHQARDVAALRRKAYLEQGIDVEALAVALWEKLIEGDSTAADAVQAIREQIKEEIK
jgi:hypothetical protein